MKIGQYFLDILYFYVPSSFSDLIQRLPLWVPQNRGTSALWPANKYIQGFPRGCVQRRRSRVDGHHPLPFQGQTPTLFNPFAYIEYFLYIKVDIRE